MGKVWVAQHTGLKTEVVVKFMAKTAEDSDDAAMRFEREAAVAAAVKSPHVVHTYDYGVTSDGQRYIVMEKLEGRDLADYLDKQGKMPPRDVALLVAQVAKALGKAHQVGVIHRDIKPENIFLCDTADGSGELFVKVLDFGIAKASLLVQTTSTVTGQVVGTPFYMSPEQIVGDNRIDARSDIWSLGVVAFEAITGKRPFDGATIGAITLALHNTKPRMTSIMPDAPPALDDWFARACCHNPEGRFDSAREAANALLEAVGEQNASFIVRPPAMSDPSLGEPRSDERPVTHLSSAFHVTKPPRKVPVVLVVIGVAALVGAAIAALVPFHSSTPAPPVAAPQPEPPSSATASATATATASASAAPIATEAPADSAKQPSKKPIIVAKPPVTRPTATSRPVKRGNDDDIK
jgi:serine/threonine-protein kinase